jgi:hypothetical protein
MTPVLFQIIYTVWVVWFAYLNKLWIRNDAGFRHWANAIAHLSASVFVGLHWGWLYGFAILFEVRAIFDGTLSLFRGLSFDYVSPKPSSFFDKVEKKIFGMNGMLPKIIYISVAIAINIYMNL